MSLVDINCDMGEGIGNDQLIMPFINSASIACGYHAGDENTMKKTVELAMKFKVAVGAHPSFSDRENFGRTDMRLPLQEVYDLVTKQIHILSEIALTAGTQLHHVKPHGALYNMAARAKPLAAVIALAVKDVNEKLILYGLSGSHLIKEAKKIGLKSASEVFADRTYQDDGRLTHRTKAGALITETDSVVQQVLRMIKEGTALSVNGKIVPIVAETICIHGDGEHAVEFAKAIHEAIQRK
ncbi:MAG TPA: 5-oxoprolinase subunit PxpA [Chitinophagaceae bacterium]|nr:5-oxoprolinase subunit PxpA [Chitinophagaceae bacterium]